MEEEEEEEAGQAARNVSHIKHQLEQGIFNFLTIITLNQKNYKLYSMKKYLHAIKLNSFNSHIKRLCCLGLPQAVTTKCYKIPYSRPRTGNTGVNEHSYVRTNT